MNLNTRDYLKNDCIIAVEDEHIKEVRILSK